MRLNPATRLRVPPLRERREDLPDLVRFAFLEALRAEALRPLARAYLARFPTPDDFVDAEQHRGLRPAARAGRAARRLLGLRQPRGAGAPGRARLAREPPRAAPAGRQRAGLLPHAAPRRRAGRRSAVPTSARAPAMLDVPDPLIARLLGAVAGTRTRRTARRASRGERAAGASRRATAGDRDRRRRQLRARLGRRRAAVPARALRRLRGRSGADGARAAGAAGRGATGAPAPQPARPAAARSARARTARGGAVVMLAGHLLALWLALADGGAAAAPAASPLPDALPTPAGAPPSTQAARRPRIRPRRRRPRRNPAARGRRRARSTPRGWRASSAGRFAEAAELFARAAEHDPGNVAFATDWGFALGQAGPAHPGRGGPARRDRQGSQALLRLRQPGRAAGRRSRPLGAPRRGGRLSREGARDAEGGSQGALQPAARRWPGSSAPWAADRRRAPASSRSWPRTRRRSRARSASGCSICSTPSRSTIARTRSRTGRPPRRRGPRRRRAGPGARGGGPRRRGHPGSRDRRQPGPRERRAWRALGRLLAAHGGALELDRADEALRQALALEPAWSDLRALRAQIARRRSSLAAPSPGTHAAAPSDKAHALYQEAEEWIDVGDPIGYGARAAGTGAGRFARLRGGRRLALRAQRQRADQPPSRRCTTTARGCGRWPRACASSARPTQGPPTPARRWSVRGSIAPSTLDVQDARFARAVTRAAAADRAGALADLVAYLGPRAQPGAPGRSARASLGPGRWPDGARPRAARPRPSCWPASACSRTAPTRRCARSAGPVPASCPPIACWRSGWCTSTPTSATPRADLLRAGQRRERRRRADAAGAPGCPARRRRAEPRGSAPAGAGRRSRRPRGLLGAGAAGGRGG